MSTDAGRAHPAPEELDLLLGPGAEPDASAEATEVRAHVRDCATCAALVAEMATVRELLRTAGRDVPPPPADLDTRIAAALAAAAAGPEPAGGTTGTTVVPLQRPQPRVPRWATVAAGLVVLAGSALTAGQLIGGSGSDQATSASDQAESTDAAGEVAGAAATPVLRSGTDYGPDTLPRQVLALLNDPQERAEEPAQESAEESADGPAGTLAAPVEEPVATPQGLAECLVALGAPGAVPQVVDLATWQGEPVAVIVLDEGDRRGVWVVERTCAPGADGLVHYASVTG